MMRLALVVSLVAACGVEAPEPETSSSSQAGTSSQGTSSQGTSPQGTSSQGTSSQGTSSQGTTSGGLAVSDAQVVGTELQFWRQRTDGFWVLYAPNRTCVWMPNRSVQLGCTYVNLATQPSPLAGSQWPMNFVRTNRDGSKTTLHLKVQIGLSATHVGSVVRDTTTWAMFDLRRSGATGAIDKSCMNPGGCRNNSDLFLYDVNVVDFDGSLAGLCPKGERAFALAGTWDATATFHPSSTEFTFACTNGTIAKCVRWGYRPWTSALTLYAPDTATPLPLADHHQACVHAAMADYCGNGHSFTKNGTVIDISDGDFIAYTTWLLIGHHFTAAVREADFDAKGAFQIDHTRYAELATDPNYSIESVCPTTFQLDTGIDKYVRRSDFHPDIYVLSTPSCAHSEFELGKWLHPDCSACTGSAVIPGYCTDPASTAGWDSGCVDAARACSASSRMAPVHGECTTGVGLDKYDSGCTLALSLKGYAGCFDTTNVAGWSATCVDAANRYCTGGREHRSILGDYGFCNQLLPPISAGQF